MRESRKGFCRRGRGRSFHVAGVEDGKGTRANSGKSDTRNLEAESVRGRAECRLREVSKLKTELKHREVKKNAI